MDTLHRRWVFAFTAGEAIGFGMLPVLGGVLATSATEGLPVAQRALLLYAAAILGGFGEGAVLAAFQMRVLRDVLTDVDPHRWVVHTGAAAAVAWALGMAGPTLDDLIGLPDTTLIALGVVTSVFILLSIGTAQALLLQGVVRRPWRWLAANALGWLVGLPWTFALPMALPDDAPPWAFGLALAVGGVLMGASAGAITGRWLHRFVEERALAASYRAEPSR